MNIRKLLFCIVIPAAASFLAGAWFTLHGVSNLGIAVLLLIVALCTGWAYYVKGSGLAYYIVGWLPEVFTGYLYIKVLAGLINNEFGPMIFVLVVLLLAIMVVSTIRYGETVKKVAGIRKGIRRSEVSDDTPNQPVEHVEAEEIQQTDKNQQK